jgi:hypothetical protein
MRSCNLNDAFMSVLSENLDELFHWLESIGFPPPSRDVRIVEIKKGITNLDDRGRFHVRQDELRQPSDYEARFEELLQMGFSWLNLSCCGVYDSFLVVSIEVPANPTISRALYPEFVTPVNHSSPSLHSLDREWSVDGILVIDNEPRPS